MFVRMNCLCGPAHSYKHGLYGHHRLHIISTVYDDCTNITYADELGGTVSGACVSFNGWAMKKRGPVLVSMFSPIGTVISVVLSAITLGDTVNIGSLAGMFLMFTGLYFVLWAKGKESYPDGDCLESEFDAEKPLLS